MLHFKHTIFLFGTRFGYLTIKEAQNSKLVCRGFLEQISRFFMKNRLNKSVKFEYKNQDSCFTTVVDLWGERSRARGPPNFFNNHYLKKFYH